MKSDKELMIALRAAPASWMDVAIVVASDNRFEFVADDHPYLLNRLNSLQKAGGLPIGLAGIKSSESADRAFRFQVFQEYQGQVWAHRYMDKGANRSIPVEVAELRGRKRGIATIDGDPNDKNTIQHRIRGCSGASSYGSNPTT